MRTMLFGVLFMCGLAAVLYYFSRRRPRKKATASALFRQLVAATRDRQVADRLVERQRERHPRAAEVELVRRALEELRSDLRR